VVFNFHLSPTSWSSKSSSYHELFHPGHSKVCNWWSSPQNDFFHHNCITKAEKFGLSWFLPLRNSALTQSLKIWFMILL
jgi:hypothetical protein